MKKCKEHKTEPGLQWWLSVGICIVNAIAIQSLFVLNIHSSKIKPRDKYEGDSWTETLTFCLIVQNCCHLLVGIKNI